MLFCTFVCNDLLDADHIPPFVPLHGFPCDKTIHFHPDESFNLLAFRFNHLFLTHTLPQNTYAELIPAKKL